VITMPIVEKAVEEVEWAIASGAKAVLVRPAPATGFRGSRSIGLPEFDPVWARLEEAGIAVCMHASFAPLNRYYEQWEPASSDSAFVTTPLKLMLLQHREIEDTLAALICQGTLSRFPNLRVMSVENGASWVAHMLHQLEFTYRRVPQDFLEHPVEVFRRNIWVNVREDDARLVQLLGAIVTWLRLPAPRRPGRPGVIRRRTGRCGHRCRHPAQDHEHHRQRVHAPPRSRLTNLVDDSAI
jgi:predicted TIM-barrel fold metal-dependent hydrolase